MGRLPLPCYVDTGPHPHADDNGKKAYGSEAAIGFSQQDYEHDESTIRFTDLLSLFCGESVGMRSPCKLNKKFRNTIPCFLSAHMPVLCGRRDAAKAMELDGMMQERFTTFTFWNPVPFEHRILNFPKCGRCCAAFYLQGLPQSPASSSAAPMNSVLPPTPLHDSSRGHPISSPAEPSLARLQELVQMRSEGHLDDEEFTAAKRQLLGL